MLSGIVDCHVHTSRSFDSESNIDALCEKAIELGLSGISVTDHCEVCVEGVNDYWSFESMRGSFEDALAAKKKFEGRLKVIAGVELGQPLHNIETCTKLLSENDYDFVLSSVHYLRNGLDFYYLNYRDDGDPDEIFSAYLDELLQTVDWAGFDSLAHLTYPLRYIIHREKIDLDLSKYQKKYDDILALLAEKGRALELNTSTAPEFFVPDFELIKRFRQLGGKMITLGSDSHFVERLANSFEEAKLLLHEAGFNEIYYFEKRKPVCVGI